MLYAYVTTGWLYTASQTDVEMKIVNSVAINESGDEVGAIISQSGS